ncbi:GNAT family N-acetyltransferase [Bacteroides sp. OttesenSCG-928-F21]|nr:GNAT family N-acetyltransferase [Bacteroides sp. OttesenSCG-928-F21]
MKVRKAEPEEIDILMGIYAYAREFMKQTGNGNQWINGYPSREQILNEVHEGFCHVCLTDEDEITGAFYFREGNDPTYDKIYEGNWLNDAPYGVVHRLAADGRHKGVGTFCLRWCYEQCRNMRVDTHQDNRIMQHLLEKEGYTRCGIIYILNGTSRIAFQKCEE